MNPIVKHLPVLGLRAHSGTGYPTLLMAGPALTLEWLDGCGLFKPLDEGELAYSSGVLVEQVAEVLRDLAVNAHPMVEGVVPEPRVPCRNDMLVVLDEPLFAEVGLVNLALGFVLVEEPVVPKGLGVLLVSAGGSRLPGS
jgi:hypothetical protein